MEIKAIYQYSENRFVVPVNGRDYIFTSREKAEAFIEKKFGKED